MNFYSRLKQKLSGISIRNLSLYVTIVFAVGYVMLMTEKGTEIYARYLAFYPYEVLHGQIWRILTAIVYPPLKSGNILLGALGIFIYYNFASAVERMMGDFEYNLYFFGSILIGELGAIVYYLITKENAPFLPVYTHFSMFMAFAIMYPEASVLLFFILPIKIKWVAIVELVIYLWQLITGNLYRKVSIIAALIPIVIFYLIVRKNRSGADIISRIRFQMAQKKRQKEWKDQWK